MRAGIRKNERGMLVLKVVGVLGILIGVGLLLGFFFILSVVSTAGGFSWSGVTASGWETLAAGIGLLSFGIAAVWRL